MLPHYHNQLVKEQLSASNTHPSITPSHEMFLKPAHNNGMRSLNGSASCSSEHELIAPMVIQTKWKKEALLIAAVTQMSGKELKD
jgi:hypothetical protein